MDLPKLDTFNNGFLVLKFFTQAKQHTWGWPLDSDKRDLVAKNGPSLCCFPTVQTDLSMDSGFGRPISSHIWCIIYGKPALREFAQRPFLWEYETKRHSGCHSFSLQGTLLYGSVCTPAAQRSRVYCFIAACHSLQFCQRNSCSHKYRVSRKSSPSLGREWLGQDQSLAAQWNLLHATLSVSGSQGFSPAQCNIARWGSFSSWMRISPGHPVSRSGL